MIRRAAAYAWDEWELVMAFSGIALALGMLVHLSLEMLP